MLGFNKKTQDASPQENTGGENKVFHFIKTHKKRCIAVVAAAAVLVAVIVPRKSRSASADLAYTQEKLGRRDIVNVYDGSGTINAADSYTVKSLVTGTVLTADFELGDSIEKGDILYTIDISDVENNLASAQLSVEQAQRNYDDIAERPHQDQRRGQLLCSRRRRRRAGRSGCGHHPRHLRDAAGRGFPCRRGSELCRRSGRTGHAGHHF